MTGDQEFGDKGFERRSRQGLQGDERFERFLSQALQVPAPPAKFQAELQQQLDKTYAEVIAEGNNKSGNAVPRELLPFTTNGVALSHLNGPASAGRQASADVSQVDSLRAPARRIWRVLAAVVAAATLLLALGFWANRPVYGWASVLEALEKCQWVQLVRSAPQPEAAERVQAVSWYSSPRRLLAIQSSAERYFYDLSDKKRIALGPGKEHQTARLDRTTFTGQDKLLVLLLPLLDDALLEDSQLPKLEVLHESWETSPAAGREDPLVQLQLQLNLLGPDGKPLETGWARFLVAADTRLPVSVTWVPDAPVEAAYRSRTGNFSYPSDGPATAAALAALPRFALGDAQQTLPAENLLAEVDASEVPVPGRTIVADEIITHGVLPLQDSTERPEVALATEAPAEATGKKDYLPKAAYQGETVAAPPRPLPVPLSEKELVQRVNDILTQFWQDQGVSPVERAGDAEFLRRVYLDLTGRIPTVSEYYSFQEKNLDPDNRTVLVDELLERRDHATHLAAVWRKFLLPDGVDLSRFGGTEKFDAWLADRFAENTSYDGIVRQLLLAEGRVSESGPLLFYAALKLNPEELAAKTSRVFLGTRMECAQCHDHPFDARITQDDFWGFAAHFAQISRPEGKMEMTSPVLRVHDSNYGEVKIPDSEEVVPPRLPTASLASFQRDEDRVDLSRRQRLAQWLTDEQNRQFARATVNRLWQQLFGRGLVEPVDDMRPDNEAVCPELLDLLADDFAASGFDVRRMIRALVLSDAYQLSSEATSDEPSQALCFARMNMKAFTADQLYDCIAVATRNEGSVARGEGDDAIARTGNATRARFLQQFSSVGDSRTDYQAGIPQALTLMHGGVVAGATSLANSGLLRSLEAPFFTDEQRVETAFLATLSREPSEAERRTLLAYVQEAADDAQRGQRLGDVVWALLNSAEFVFIH